MITPESATGRLTASVLAFRAQRRHDITFTSISISSISTPIQLFVSLLKQHGPRNESLVEHLSLVYKINGMGQPLSLDTLTSSFKEYP